MNRFHKHEGPITILGVVLALTIIQIGADAESSGSTNSIEELEPELVPPKPTIWQSGIGEGFLPETRTFSLQAGVAPGMATFGSKQAHDFALMSLSYGHMLGRVLCEGHWLRGNFEGRLELFGGAQYSPSAEYIIGLTPHIRYDFATGTRWVPFLDFGAGVTATSIGPPDMSGTFEFNLQATAGLHWFLRNNLALTSEVRYSHISCAGINHPNLGANNVWFMIGVT